MILTRDKGQRMWGGGGGSSYSYGGGGGGESPSLDGFVSNEYYNQNFELLYKQEVTAGGTTTTTFMTAAPNIIVPVGTVTDETTQTTTVTSLVGPVAKNAIVLGNIMMVYDQTNNAIKVVNRDGSTAANFYATGGVSALGYNPGGGGGGDTLTEPLASINNASLGMPTAAGQVITWNGTQWIFDIPEGGGGGGTGTVTSVKMTVPTGFSISGSPITSSGTLALGFANGYSLPTTAKQSNWDTAYSWGNHANAGYMLRTEGMKFDARSGYIAARFVLADGTTYDSTRAALAQGSGYIEWWSTGGFFNHWMGNVIIGQDATDSTHYIQIGGGRIYWDNQSKSLYVVQADGSTAANFYATGGVSALGISTGGSPSVSALTVGTLTANALNMGGDINTNGGNLDMDGGDIDNVNQMNTGKLNVNGTTISRIYWNGTYLQVQIGSSTYNFKPV